MSTRKISVSEMMKLLSKFFAGQWLEHFRKTKNPLSAWEVYRHSQMARVPIPKEVIAYLDWIAERIHRIALNPPTDANKRAFAIKKAIGTRGSTFSEYKKRYEEMSIASETAKVVEEWGGKEYFAFEDMANRYGINKTKARRMYKKYFE